jgi:hypothetical protein
MSIPRVTKSTDIKMFKLDTYPSPFVLDEDLLVPMSGNCDESFFAQHDTTADGIRKFTAPKERLKLKKTSAFHLLHENNL